MYLFFYKKQARGAKVSQKTRRTAIRPTGRVSGWFQAVSYAITDQLLPMPQPISCHWFLSAPAK